MSDQHPGYRTWQGDPDDALPLMPPFRSLGLQNRYYPLPADLQRLQAFCDRYLNREDSDDWLEQGGRFEARVPYVMLIDCTHPHLEVDRRDYGWFSQRELTLAFIAEWHRKREGRWQFEGLVFVNPFIYLDSPLGLTTGREVQGWPKQLGRFDDQGGLRVRADRGGRLDVQELMRIEARPPGLMPDPRAWTGALARRWRWLVEMAGAARSMWQSPGDVEDLLARWRAYLLPAQDWNIVTLKQFPDLVHPELAAYQALVRSTMETERVLCMAPLGAPALLWGDPTGGYRIHFHRPAADPLLDVLGIQVEGEGPVAMAEPLLPFRMDLDIRYPAGEVLVERRQVPYVPVAAGQQPEASLALEELDLHLVELPADGASLAAAAGRCFGDVPVRVHGEVVYLLAGAGQARLGGEGGPRLAFQTAGFYVPAQLDGEALWLAPFEFLSDGTLSTLARELYGAGAAVGRSTGSWLGEASDDQRLCLRSLGFTALHEGEEAHRPALVRVRGSDGAAPKPKTVGNGAAEAKPQSFTLLNLKQFRDAAHPARACYRALARAEVQVQVLSARPEPGPLTVEFRDSATFPLARTLGLEVERTPGSELAVCRVPGALHLSARLNIRGGSETPLAATGRRGGGARGSSRGSADR